MYTDKVMEHFMHPRNVGTIPEADGVGEVGNPVCGDMMTFYIKVKDGRLEDVKFQTFGCGAAIAVSSLVSEMAKGKTLEEAMKITNQQVAEELGGLPPHKMHCSNLGADALHKAIENYLSKKSGQQEEKAAESSQADHKNEHFHCPFCDFVLPENAQLCARCQIKLIRCEHCGEYNREGEETCGHCGAGLV
ncbi:MAG: Fe-S cluster assembly scaffold protein NifU [Candidatus Aminicenantes bacterium]|nr:Fe-S cluster assembly scaffold protein NifU [Candidatus Aminicenantes bacterium]